MKKDYETFETEKEAIDFLNSSSETGEAFGDCIVDEDGVIVRDINSSTEVIGRETPENRVGNVYKEVKKGTVENTSIEANNMFAQKLSVLNKKFNPRKEESADEFSYVYDSEEGWVVGVDFSKTSITADHIQKYNEDNLKKQTRECIQSLSRDELIDLLTEHLSAE